MASTAPPSSSASEPAQTEIIRTATPEESDEQTTPRVEQPPTQQPPPQQPPTQQLPPPVTTYSNRDRDLPARPTTSQTVLTTQSQPDSMFSSSPMDRNSTPPTTAGAMSPQLKTPATAYEALPTRRNTYQERNQPGATVGRYPSRSARAVLSLDGNGPPQPSRMQSGLDWIVPSTERRERTAGERLEPTLATARTERDKFASNAKWQGMALNLAIGLQVVVGALTTGVAAATTGRATSIGVSILGGMSTCLASYLAKSRGSNEPEFSEIRARELNTYVRELEAWVMDNGHLVGSDHDDTINKFRQRYEEIIRTDGEDPSSETSFLTQTKEKQDHKAADSKV